MFFRCKIDVVNRIMSPRLKYRQWFMTVDKVLAKGPGALGDVKPHKEECVKVHGCRGAPCRMQVYFLSLTCNPKPNPNPTRELLQGRPAAATCRTNH